MGKIMIIRLIYLFFSCFVSNTVFAVSIETYLKKIEKTGNYGLKNIDCAYIINLDQRPEKLKSCVDQLSHYNIFPYRFSAINGWELPLETLNNIGVRYEQEMPKDQWGTYYLPTVLSSALSNIDWHHEIMHVHDRNYVCYKMARGPIGIVLSHLSVLKDAYDSGYKTIWVMEDDIQVIKDPNLISSYIDKLDALVGNDQWDILFTDKDTKDKQGNYVICLSYAPRPNFTPQNPERFAMRQQVGTDFMKVGARYGAYSMIIRRSGIKKLLDYFFKYRVFLPYDMDFFMSDDIRLYTVIDDIVSTQPQAISDNRSPAYLGSEYIDNDFQQLPIYVSPESIHISSDPYPRKFDGMFKEYEVCPLDLIERFLPANPTIFEAGGHYGTDTIKFAQKWPHAKIMSFEPNPHAFKKYLETTQIYKNITGYNLAVNNYNGTARLNICYGTTGDNPIFEGASSLLEPTKDMKIHYQGPVIEVPCVILDDWCKKNNINHIDFMWLDLEGLELQVLKSSPTILATLKVIFTETNFYNFRIGTTHYIELRAFLESSGFQMLSHWYNEGLQGNAIFIRDQRL